MTVFEISRAAFNCFGHAKQNRSRIQNHAKAELEELFWRKPWGLTAAFEHANGQWNLSEFLPDRLQLLQIGRPPRSKCRRPRPVDMLLLASTHHGGRVARSHRSGPE